MVFGSAAVWLGGAVDVEQGEGCIGWPAFQIPFCRFTLRSNFEFLVVYFRFVFVTGRSLHRSAAQTFNLLST
ncbi:hypothetical protein SBA5_150003 [Candidatus Sulfotelmatomonas gaucii]|uniref:Uncharacterized protein n=1 Tax=Candidatus Sulfuritelmatomonas gaucii TaxID=2043161 RepID=A0A2N9L4W3_9BACT|nr:hypothetical protein SBA5_150003 [Candidatus Sulfotelmatomonas gaucii]